MIRLQKYLAECGVASRRQSERLIIEGRVTVNGLTAQLGQGVDPATDSVDLNGEPVRLDEKVYILLNKPRGVITSLKDTHHRKTVIDCLSGVTARVFPVGRLDLDVEGALILTNDGELAYRIMHPSYHIEKVYLAWVRGQMQTETAVRLERGVPLDDGRTSPAKVVILNQGNSSTLIQLTLHEGRKREVKRMCAQVGHEVHELQRIAIGNIHIKGMKPGEWRRLREGEIHGLYELAGLG